MPVVPRWEWRTFGRRLGDAGDRLAALTPDRVHESDEVYLVSRRGPATVKFRDDLVDLKRLVEVDDRGLEMWIPVLKAAFPLSASDVRTVWEALGVGVPPLPDGEYTPERVRRELIDPDDDLMRVHVHKHRRRYVLDGCHVELTDVTADRARTRSVAVESEDPDLVARTVEALGFGLRPNTSYPRALQALAGAAGDRSAVIDVGTNSVKFLVGEVTGDGPWRTVTDRAVVTRLGEGLAGAGRIAPEPMRRTADAVCGMADEARRLGAFDIAVAGTAGLRIAANSAEFAAAVRGRCGVRVEVVAGDEEARLGYVAAVSLAGRGGGPVTVFETGGGSSQFTFGHGDRIDDRVSVDVGAARVTERFGLDGVTTPDVVDRACAEIAGELGGLAGRPAPGILIGVGGAFTNLAAVMHGLATYAPDVVHGTVLDRAEIDRQIALYADSTAEHRRSIVGLQPARAEVILAGACIVRTAMDVLGAASVVVSDRGLRHGLFEERFARESGAVTARDTGVAR